MKTLTVKIHDQGLVTLLKQIHDELDQAVLEAYGWQDIRSRDIPVANKETPHSCGAGESAVYAPREALSSSAPLSPSRQECRVSLLTRLVAINHERATEEKTSDSPAPNPPLPNPKSMIVNPTGPDPAAIAGHFGKRTKPRIQQISEILKTLSALGKL